MTKQQSLEVFAIFAVGLIVCLAMIMVNQ